METDALRLLQNLRIETSRASLLWGAALRALTQEETEALKVRGNRCADWSRVRVAPEFSPDFVQGNRLSGDVALGRFGPQSGVFDSWIEDSEIADEVSVVRGSFLQKCVVGKYCRIDASRISCSGATSYAIGTTIKAGLEVSGKELPIHENLDLATAQELTTSERARRETFDRANEWKWDRTYVGEFATISNSNVDRAFLTSHVAIENRSTLDTVCVVSNEREPVRIEDCALVRRCILQNAVSIETGAQAVDSIFLEHSGAERNALVTSSLIGPNSHVGAGEVTASFLGPFVGLHHHSLLISAWWPEGRGNLGYGANVGSNHTSRSPDQEIYPGEGTFFGLGCVVKFPTNFQEAPYCLVSSGITTLPQKLALPFSLLLEEHHEDPTTRGLNRVVPAWMLSDNVYSLLRSEEKFKQRNRARKHTFDFRIARPDLVDKVWKARESLASKSGKSVYVKADIPAVGKNFLLEADRVRAIDAYDEFLTYAVLKIAFEDAWGMFSCSSDWLEVALERCSMTNVSWEDRGERWLELETRYLATATVSRQKDEQRGQEIIPDYSMHHASFEEDEFLKKRRISLEMLQKRIRKIHEKKT